MSSGPTEVTSGVGEDTSDEGVGPPKDRSGRTEKTYPSPIYPLGRRGRTDPARPHSHTSRPGARSRYQELRVQLHCTGVPSEPFPSCLPSTLSCPRIVLGEGRRVTKRGMFRTKV